MKKVSLIMLLIAAALLSFTSCKKEAEHISLKPKLGDPDPALLGSWGWYSFDNTVYNDNGVEHETPPPFHYGRGDTWYDFRSDGTFYTEGDDNNSYPGYWG